MIVKASNFVQRQTPASRYSHFDGTWEELEDMAWQGMRDWTFTSGYRDGVILVQVSAERFMCSTHVLAAGEELIARYLSRKEGELPRKSIHKYFPGGKSPAKRVDLVLYRKDVLEEDPSHQAIPDADWEIVSINASLTDFPEPMPPETMMANHFHVPGSNDGGTSTGLSDAEFVARLRESYEYWRNKTMG